MGQAPLEESGSGLAPTGAGWFVVNAADATWLTTEGGESSRPAPLSGLAARHGASVEPETSDPDEAYAEWEPPRRERPSSRDRLPWT